MQVWGRKWGQLGSSDGCVRRGHHEARVSAAGGWARNRGMAVPLVEHIICGENTVCQAEW